MTLLLYVGCYFSTCFQEVTYGSSGILRKLRNWFFMNTVRYLKDRDGRLGEIYGGILVSRKGRLVVSLDSLTLYRINMVAGLGKKFITKNGNIQSFYVKRGCESE